MKLKEKYKRIQQVLHNYAVSIKLHDCDNGRLIDEFNLLQDTMFDYELCLKKNVEYRTALKRIDSIIMFNSDEELWEYVQNNLDDVMSDYRDVKNIAKEALEGDEE